MHTLHRHHKTPKHAGGTNDASNLELLTVAEHAEAHKLLFERYGREEDRIAWLGLAGLIGKDEIVKLAQSLGGKAASGETNPWRNKRTPSNWAVSSQNQLHAQTAAQSQSAKAKRKQTFEKIGHQRKEANSMFGTSVYRDSEGNKRRFLRGMQPIGWLISTEWFELRKDKKNGAYGKKWFNDGNASFLIQPSDERAKILFPGRLNPGFGSKPSSHSSTIQS
jgi:hypothetical protein